MQSFRFQLLAAVNIAIAVLLGAFLVLDYRTEIAQRVSEKHSALQEEVDTLLPAVVQMRASGSGAIQRYIDGVCGRMRETVSPGHHIAVQMGAEVLQAVTHDRASPEIFAAMQDAAQSPAYQSGFGEERMVAARSQQEDVTVYASEFVTNVRRAAGRRMLHRLLRIAVLAIATAVVVNAVFARLANRPLRRLVQTVRQIEQGKLGVRAGAFNTAEFRYLAEAIDSMSCSLAEVERLRRAEMARARRIQEQLLPEPENIQAGSLRFARLYRPAEDVAGDYYDIVTLRDGTWLACIADVTGHGVAAALSATMLKAFLQEAIEHHCDPSAILRSINQRLTVACRTENFASMCVVRCDPRSQSLQYASAGHESGLLLRGDGRLTELPSTGLLLGIMAHTDWQTQTVAIRPGDRLLLATDGATEAMDGDEQPFGRQRLAETWRETGRLSLTEAIECVGHILEQHAGDRRANDDVTLLALEVAPSPATAGTAPVPWLDTSRPGNRPLRGDRPRSLELSPRLDDP